MTRFVLNDHDFCAEWVSYSGCTSSRRRSSTTSAMMAAEAMVGGRRGADHVTGLGDPERQPPPADAPSVMRARATTTARQKEFGEKIADIDVLHLQPPATRSQARVPADMVAQGMGTWPRASTTRASCRGFHRLCHPRIKILIIGL
jgi:hypothetical protein